MRFKIAMLKQIQELENQRRPCVRDRVNNTSALYTICERRTSSQTCQVKIYNLVENEIIICYDRVQWWCVGIICAWTIFFYDEFRRWRTFVLYFSFSLLR